MLTEREQLFCSYFSLASQKIFDGYNSAISDMVFGKEPNLCDTKLLAHLWFYLDIVYQQRLIDSQNAGDRGVQAYIEDYCIAQIKKALRCRDFEDSIINKLINVYLGTGIYGLGQMAIQGPDPYFQIAGGGNWSLIQPGITHITPPPGDGILIPTPVTSIFTNVNADKIFSDVIPAGYELISVVFQNTTDKISQLSLGITVGGSEAFGSASINGYESILKGMTTVTVGKCFSTTKSTTLYLNHAGPGDVWNGANYNLNLVMIKVQ